MPHGMTCCEMVTYASTWDSFSREMDPRPASTQADVAARSFDAAVRQTHASATACHTDPAWLALPSLSVCGVVQSRIDDPHHHRHDAVGGRRGGAPARAPGRRAPSLTPGAAAPAAAGGGCRRHRRRPAVTAICLCATSQRLRVTGHARVAAVLHLVHQVQRAAATSESPAAAAASGLSSLFVQTYMHRSACRRFSMQSSAPAGPKLWEPQGAR